MKLYENVNRLDMKKERVYRPGMVVYPFKTRIEESESDRRCVHIQLGLNNKTLSQKK